jgi:hypothetical protein
MQGATTAQLQEIAVALDHRGQSPQNHHFLLLTVCDRSDAERNFSDIERRISLFR